MVRNKKYLTDYLLWNANEDARRCYKQFIKFLMRHGVYERYVAAFFHPRNKEWLEDYEDLPIRPYGYISSAFDWAEECESFHQSSDIAYVRFWNDLSTEWQEFILKNNLC